jgi:hypothetical protein
LADCLICLLRQPGTTQPTPFTRCLASPLARLRARACRQLRSDIINLSINTLTNSKALRAAVRAACVTSGILLVK